MQEWLPSLTAEQAKEAAFLGGTALAGLIAGIIAWRKGLAKKAPEATTPPLSFDRMEYVLTEVRSLKSGQTLTITRFDEIEERLREYDAVLDEIRSKVGAIYTDTQVLRDRGR